MLSALLNRFNTHRKEKLLNAPLFHTEKQYAFVGVGMHSLTNLYPILRHFGISLRYIHTRQSSWQQQMTHWFPNCRFTNNLQEIIDDVNVAGVFVCTKADAHFGILTSLLQSNKAIFVEKPPCHDLRQLQQLIQINPQAICKVGLQRRYWPGNRFVTRKVSNAGSYTYQFHVGPYLQGDTYTELFIHAFDFCQHLFGNYTVQSFSKHQDKSGITAQLHVKHDKQITGLIELSTQHSWNDPQEVLQVNTPEEHLSVRYPILVEGTRKPQRILNIPTERLLQQPVVRKTYFSTGQFIAPVLELNTLVLQGFYRELETFIQLAEGKRSGEVHVSNDLPGLAPIYGIIETLRN